MTKRESEFRSRAPQAYRLSIWNVPLLKSDAEKLVEKMYQQHLKHARDTTAAVDEILDRNEKVVSRCGLLMNFSGILIMLSIFAAAGDRVLIPENARGTFYLVMLIWVVSTLRLLLSLRHKLPTLSDYGTSEDLRLTISLYVERLRIYDLALITAIVCFAIIAVLLSPITVGYFDRIFHPGLGT